MLQLFQLYFARQFRFLISSNSVRFNSLSLSAFSLIPSIRAISNLSSAAILANSISFFFFLRHELIRPFFFLHRDPIPFKFPFLILCRDPIRSFLFLRCDHIPFKFPFCDSLAPFIILLLLKKVLQFLSLVTLILSHLY